MHATRSTLTWVWNVVCWSLMLASFFLLLTSVGLPRLASATPYTILTGSMTGTYPAGTLVVTKPTPPDALNAGDVITYQLESGKPDVVTHRIIAVSTDLTGNTLFRTQGDANDAPDERLVLPAQIRGQVWYHVPYAGHLAQHFTAQDRWRANYVLAAALLAYSLWAFGSLFWSRKKNKPGPPDGQNKRKSREKLTLRSPKLGPAPGVFRYALGGMAVALASVGLILPTGAYFNSQAMVDGVSVKAGTVAVTPTVGCVITNTITGQPEPGASCGISLAPNGCANSWATAANVYVRITMNGAVPKASNNYGNAMRIDFSLDLQAAGCNPPGVNWNATGRTGFEKASSFTYKPGYKCADLPMWSGSTSYYNTGAGLPVYLGQLIFNRNQNANHNCAV